MIALVRAPRLYVDMALQAGVLVDLPQVHYLTHVMRAKAGDIVRLFNGRDGEWTAEMIHFSKRAVQARLDVQIRPQAPEPGPHLLFAPLKKARLDMLIEKAVELGAARLTPVLCTHCVTDKIRPDKLQVHIIEAAEQCERLTIPQLDAPLSLAEALSGTDMPYVALARTDAALLGPDPAAAVLIGPEGGFSQEELALINCTEGVRPVSLGPRILRAETAAMAALIRMTA